MANRYGEAAILAARAEAEYRSHPADRWMEVIKRLYPTSPTAQRKSGPRHAFLTLCEAGLVKGIPAGQYAAAHRGKTYASRAVSLLEAGTHTTINSLWVEVNDGESTPHTGQMDVVLALWKNNLIVRKSSPSL
jgi:hypothetical protein